MYYELIYFFSSEKTSKARKKAKNGKTKLGKSIIFYFKLTTIAVQLTKVKIGILRLIQ